MNSASEMNYVAIADYLRAWAAHIRSGGPITVSLVQAEKLERAVEIITRLGNQAEEIR